MKSLLILVFIFLKCINLAHAETDLFLKDRPASYCQIYTSTAVTILIGRLSGISERNSIENNQSLSMGEKYNRNVLYLAKQIYSENFDVSNLMVNSTNSRRDEDLADFTVSVYEKCLFDKYGIDPWNEYLKK